MPESLCRLTENIVDYAGLFPPAKLDMSPVVTNYASYLESGESWMLERLIIPVARLDEFEAAVTASGTSLLPPDDDDDPWPISALTRPAGDDDGLKADLERIAKFNDVHAFGKGGKAIIDVIELRATNSDGIDSALDLMPEDIFPFFEIPWQDDPRGAIASLVGGDAGAKIRTGGIEASLVPPIDAVARFIVACARADVPFKATAGLHHPLRHHDTSIDTVTHGFINVFAAAVLALQLDLDETAVTTILSADSIDFFDFDDAGMSCAAGEVSNDEIEDARLSFALSFGSCSFDEPRDDLRSLGLL